jgi:hypothetical protein
MLGQDSGFSIQDSAFGILGRAPDPPRTPTP